MSRRPKDIGTAGETVVVKYARTYGYPYADRQPLRGNRDCGDLTFCPGFIGEVKAGDAARTASDALILNWLHETTAERINADADMALLVVARWRQPVERWWAVLWACDIVDLGVHSQPGTFAFEFPVRLLLRDALTLTRTAGYGSPLTPALETA